MTARPDEIWESFLRDLEGREDLDEFVAREAGDFLTLANPARSAPQPPPDELEWLRGAVPGLHAVREIGRGGMGVVLEVIQRSTERRAALKILNPDLRDPRFIRRLEREAVALGRLDHPNIARLYAAGQCRGQLRGTPWILMEYVEGLPLLEAIDAHGLDLRQRATVIMHIADAIACAHEHGVLHLDLKPGNILVRADLVPKVLDFGIARLLDDKVGESTLTLLTHGFGTLTAMAPEQFEGRAGGACSDVYALGAMLYRALTGVHPVDLDGVPFTRAAQRVINDTPRSPREFRRDIPADLETIVLTALEKSPMDRYISAAAMRDDLRRWLGGEPIHAKPTGAMGRLWRLAKRNRREAGLLTLGVVTVLSVATVAVVQAVDARRAQADAEGRLVDLRALSTSLVVDFIDQLERVPGAVEIRAEVLRRTLDSYRALEHHALKDPEFARELVDAYTKLGAALGHPDFASLGLPSAKEPLDHAAALGERALERFGMNAPLARATAFAHQNAHHWEFPPYGPAGSSARLERASELTLAASRLDPGRVEDDLSLLRFDIRAAHAMRNHQANPGGSLDRFLELFPRVREILPRIDDANERVDLLIRAALPAGIVSRESGRPLDGVTLFDDALSLLGSQPTSTHEGLRPVLEMRILSLHADYILTRADAGLQINDRLEPMREIVRRSREIDHIHSEDGTIGRTAMVTGMYLSNALAIASESPLASPELLSALPEAVEWAEWSLERLRRRIAEGTATGPDLVTYEPSIHAVITRLLAAQRRAE
ncbi:MAG: serine/threonine protein kinase [Phycisphaeraceae bacterium]|nr:serine/threonine protein kinase [Phycisphaeraceae bacterium]